jgi:hypothetical protein
MTRDHVGRMAGWAVGLATALELIAGTTMLLSFVGRHPGSLPVQTIASIFYELPVVLAFSVLSIAISRRWPRHPVGRLFGLLGVVGGFGLLAEGSSAWELRGTDWVIWLWSIQESGWFFGLAMTLLLFPTGRYPSMSWRWLARLLWLYVAAAVIVTAVAPWPRQDGAVVLWVQDYRDSWPAHNPIGWDSPPWLADAGALVAPFGVLLLLASLLSVFLRWRRSAGEERQQIKWLGLASLLFAVGVTAAAIQLLTIGEQQYRPFDALVGNAVFTLLLIGIPVAIGLGIIRYRLYDVDVFISSTMLYGGLAVFIGLGYLLGVAYVSQLVDRWTGSSTLLAVTTTAAVAAAFQPLRTALRSGADRLVFGDRAAPYELMTRFGHELGQAWTPSTVLARIAETAAQAARARSARVTTTFPDGETLVGTWSAATAPASFDFDVPVLHNGTVVASLAVAGAANRPADLALLRDVAAVSAAALVNVRLLAELDALHEAISRQNRELAASKSRLIRAAEIERRELEDRVERRLGPDLILLHNALPALRNESVGQPDALVAECERLAAHATHLVDEIRALSRGILPPVLLDHGLGAALRALVRRLDVEVTLDVPALLAKSRFPLSVETTVYLSCQAALTQAATADGTARATLRLWYEPGRLVFSVTHNADQAWSDDADALQDRIAALGGELVFGPGDQGSAIRGTLPLDGGPWLNSAMSQVDGTSGAG